MAKLRGCACLTKHDKYAMRVALEEAIKKNRYRPESLETLRPLYEAVLDTPTCEDLAMQRQRSNIAGRAQMQLGQTRL